MRLYELSNNTQKFEASIKASNGVIRWIYDARNQSEAVALVNALFGSKNVMSVRVAHQQVKEVLGAVQTDTTQIEVDRLQNQAKQSNIQAKRIKAQSQIRKAQQQLSKINNQQ